MTAGQAVPTEQLVGPVVVGVDGSPESREVMLRALDEARWRGVGLIVVHAFNFDAPSMMAYSDVALREFLRTAQVVVNREVEFARAQGMVVEGRAIYGTAAKVLVDTASDASLLVVGCRHRGAIAEALLGSVTTACLHHATCPVLVVPSATSAADRGGHPERSHAAM